MVLMSHICEASKVTVNSSYFHPTHQRYTDEAHKAEMVPFYCVIQKVCVLCDEKAFVKKEEHFIAHAEDARCDISIESALLWL
jgi:hypothetical protein